VGSGELLALTSERDVLEWVLGDRAEPPIPLGVQDCGHAGEERHDQ
jgi:hypothetical protein